MNVEMGSNADNLSLSIAISISMIPFKFSEGMQLATRFHLAMKPKKIVELRTLGISRIAIAQLWTIADCCCVGVQDTRPNLRNQRARIRHVNSKM